MVSTNSRDALVDWVPIVFVLFKGGVFATGMYFAVKWHYDQEKKKGADGQALLRMGAKFAGVFLLLLIVLLTFTFGLARMLGMDLSLP